MVRKLAVFLLISLFSISACAHTIQSPARSAISHSAVSPSPTRSVHALQSNGQTFCTAFSINASEGYWATAAHCAVYALENKLEVTIEGQSAWIVMIGFPATDVAVLQSFAYAPALPLAAGPISVGDAVSIIGYPYGIARIQTWGHIAARHIPLRHPSTNYYMLCDILDVTVAGGNSGSPVLNSLNEVVGLLWGGFNASPHSIAIPLDALRRVLDPFLQDR